MINILKLHYNLGYIMANSTGQDDLFYKILILMLIYFY